MPLQRLSHPDCSPYGTVSKHVWDGQNILLETDSSNSIQVVYTLNPTAYGNLISQDRGGTSSFYLFDGSGSTTQLVNSFGSVTDDYVYDSFGNILADGTTVNPFKYIGIKEYYYDSDTSIIYMRARYYSPSIGRFFSRDPITGIIRFKNNLRLHPYIYSLSNPLIFIDPSGTDAISDRLCGWGEGVTCISLCGILQCGGGRLLGREASKQGDLASSNPGKQDAMRHCLWLCWMAGNPNIGPEMAGCIGFVHEICDPNFLKSVSSGETGRDFHNNEVGR